MNNYAYLYEGKLYLNLTNKCSNACEFCLRNYLDGVGGNNLWLEKEPTFDDVKNSLNKFRLEKFDEVIFCGFGEPLCNFAVLKQSAEYLKQSGKKVRLNTNGQGNLINGRDITPELKGLIDAVNISLNYSTREKYQSACRSVYGENAFDAMLDFAEKCKKVIPEVILSKVDEGDEEDNKACEEICRRLGVKFRLRKKV